MTAFNSEHMTWAERDTGGKQLQGLVWIKQDEQEVSALGNQHDTLLSLVRLLVDQGLGFKEKSSPCS